MAQEIRVFDSTGVFVRRVGRKGSGPGEFTEAIGLDWDPRGHLWIVDQRSGRYSVVDTSGRVVAERRRPISDFAVFSWKGGLDSTGNVYEYYQRPGLGTELLLRYDSSLSRADTFPLPHSEAGFFKLERANLRVRARIPFNSTVIWVLDRRGLLWFGQNDRYRVIKTTLTGDTLAVLDRPVELASVTEGERDSAVAALQWFTKQGGRIDRSAIPTRKPAFASMFLDDRGNLWVVPIVAGPENGYLLDAFDASGRFTRRIRTDFPVRPNNPVVIRGSTIYAVTEDEAGITFIVRGTIPSR